MRGIGVAVSASRCGSPPLALGLQRGALADAEAMLLVDDRQAQPRELDRLADHGVRADDDLGLAGRDRVVDLPLAAAVQRSGQELGPNAQARRAAAPGRRGAVARGSRSAPSALPATRRARRRPGRRPRRRSCRCRRRPGAGAASADPTPGPPRSRRRRPPGRRSGANGRAATISARSASAHRDPRRLQSGTRLARLGQRELQGQQLVEGQPVERLGDIGRLLREVRRPQGIVERPAGRRAPHRCRGSSTAGSASSSTRASSSRSRFWVTPAARW